MVTNIVAGCWHTRPGFRREPMKSKHTSRDERSAKPESLEDNRIGPIPEINRYGEPTGYQFLRCRCCGTEVMTESREHATHYEGCSFQ